MTPGLHGIVLHLRCRAVPATVLVFLAAAALTWAAYLSDDPATTQRLGLIAVVLGVAPTARTLAGPDEELERGTPAPWRLIRAVHLLLLGGVLLGLLVVVHRIAGQQAHAVAYGTVVQAVLALTALTALGAVLVGARAAWVLPIGWAMLMLAVGPRESVIGQALTWMVQEPGTVTSTTVVALLTVVGVAAYTRRGSRL
ncbi:hypothetical protein [Streptomyces phaeochromogenes]|uniref:hypothetical protein n=1 Tax=Streptomyces phaeochromogenes TaxID=1923 RepID=UPI00386ACF4B|nr:hypothetical protein OHB08_21130 [Streptomyces phaeochromogenes]